MSTAEIAVLALSEADHRVQLRRAVVAGKVGTIIEAYDFLLYVQVAPLVFARLYFPSSDPLVGTRVPVFEVLKRQPRLTALARMAEQGPFYIYAGFIFTYGTTVLHSSRNLLLTAVMIATALSAITTPLSGHISDRIGRKRMYLIGAATMGVFGFLYFTLLNTAMPGWIFVAVILSFIPHDMMYGPQAAMIAECFSPRLRYSGSSLGFHLSSVIAGGPAPIIATALLAWTGSGYAVAGYILFCAIVSIAATIPLPDRTNQDISQEIA